MNLAKIKEDAEIASIDYSDRFKVKIEVEPLLFWVVKNRITKDYVIKSIYPVYSNSDRFRFMPPSASKYYDACKIDIVIDINREIQLRDEVAINIIDKLKILNEYVYHFEPTLVYNSLHRIVISYVVYEPIVLSAPKRTK